MPRVFFALWPDADVAQALHAAGRMAHTTCGGRLMRRDTLHMTLAFLGDVDPGKMDVACDAAAKVGAGETPLRLTIDRLGYWQHNHIVWAGCSQTPPGLATLAADLGGHLRCGGFALEERPFVAHATLLRDAACAGVPPPAPIVWNVAEFVLVESQPAAAGAHYRILRRWPLGPAQGHPACVV